MGRQGHQEVGKCAHQLQRALVRKLPGLSQAAKPHFVRRCATPARYRDIPFLLFKGSHAVGTKGSQVYDIDADVMDLGTFIKGYHVGDALALVSDRHRQIQCHAHWRSLAFRWCVSSAEYTACLRSG